MSTDCWLVVQRRTEYERRRQLANTEAGELWYDVPSQSPCFEFGDTKDAGGYLLVRVAPLSGELASRCLQELKAVFQETSDFSEDAWTAIAAAAQGDSDLRCYFWLR